MNDATIATIATSVAPNYGLGTTVARSIVRKVLELAAELPESKEAGLAANLARLKLENGKLKKLVATRERQRDALAAKILTSKGRKVQPRQARNEDDDA